MFRCGQTAYFLQPEVAEEPDPAPEVALELPGDRGPTVLVPAMWAEGVALPATWEPEEIPGHPDHGLGDRDCAPPPLPEPPIDALAAARKGRALLPDGRYQIEIVPHGFKQFTSATTRGIGFIVKVMAGAETGTEVGLKFLVDGPAKLDGVVARDLDILTRWHKGLGLVEPIPDVVDLIAALGRAGERRVVMLTLARQVWNGGARMVAVDVEVSLNFVHGSGGRSDD